MRPKTPAFSTPATTLINPRPDKRNKTEAIEFTSPTFCFSVLYIDTPTRIRIIGKRAYPTPKSFFKFLNTKSPATPATPNPARIKNKEKTKRTITIIVCLVSFLSSIPKRSDSSYSSWTAFEALFLGGFFFVFLFGFLPIYADIVSQVFI